MRRIIRAVSALLVVPTLASCGGDMISPTDLFGHVYALQNTPVVLQPAGGGQLTILADTLILGAEPAIRRVRMQVQSTPVVSFTEQYTLELGRGRLELHYVCPPNALALCTPPPHLWGLPSGSGLVLRAQVDPTVPLQYARVPTNVRLFGQ